ncbi:YbaB/EbfC family nucleoid-associated protein [Sphingobacterium hungaricum]
MFDKLMAAQQKAQEIKTRLDSITVTGEAEGGKIRVTASANKEIKSIHIADELVSLENKEELEELLLVALNKAIAQAENISQSEMQAATQNMFGDLGNLFGNNQ